MSMFRTVLGTKNIIKTTVTVIIKILIIANTSLIINLLIPDLISYRFIINPFFGAGDETRTHDIHLGKVTLYQLSYARILFLLMPKGLVIAIIKSLGRTPSHVLEVSPSRISVLPQPTVS